MGLIPDLGGEKPETNRQSHKNACYCLLFLMTPSTTIVQVTFSKGKLFSRCHLVCCDVCSGSIKRLAQLFWCSQISECTAVGSYYCHFLCSHLPCCFACVDFSPISLIIPLLCVLLHLLLLVLCYYHWYHHHHHHQHITSNLPRKNLI